MVSHFTETQILCVDFLIAVNVVHHYHKEEIATHFKLNGYMREDEKNNITARYTIHPEAVLDPLHKKRLLVPEGGSIACILIVYLNYPQLIYGDICIDSSMTFIDLFHGQIWVALQSFMVSVQYPWINFLSCQTQGWLEWGTPAFVR